MTGVIPLLYPSHAFVTGQGQLYFSLPFTFLLNKLGIIYYMAVFVTVAINDTRL
jgi:hypothetical protein